MAGLEIDVNKAVLDGLIGKLSILKNNAECFKLTRPEIRGGGSNVNMIESLSDFYEDMYDKLLLLYDNSIVFFTNLSNTVTESDENASNAYE